MCTYENCTESEQLFSTQKSWIDHESTIHRGVWRCYQHPEHYESADGLRAHFLTVHSDSLVTSQIEGLIPISRVGLPDNRPFCPVCFMIPPFADGLEAHVANHLERFSLFSLPCTSDIEDLPDGSDASKDVNGHLGVSTGSGLSASSSNQGLGLLNDEIKKWDWIKTTFNTPPLWQTQVRDHRAS